MMYATLLVTWLLLFNQYFISQTFGSADESDEVDIDEEIADTTENTVSSRFNGDESQKTTTSTNKILVSSTISSKIDASDSPEDDIIELNIGGERITTLRSTLTAIPGSKLALMFSKDESINVKSSGKESTSYFFDYDPAVFKLLLTKLRHIKRMQNYITYELRLQNIGVYSEFGYSDLITDLELTDQHFLSPMNGFHLNLNRSSLIGWKECYRSKYDKPFNISILNDTCKGRQLLVACRYVKNESILTVAGVSMREHIFGSSSENSIRHHHGPNNMGFYYVANRFLGFKGCPQNGCPYCSRETLTYSTGSKSRHSFHQDSDGCDSSDCNAEYRLCWSMLTSVGGDRCGSVKNLHFSKEWERLIFQTN